MAISRVLTFLVIALKATHAQDFSVQLQGTSPVDLTVYEGKVVMSAYLYSSEAPLGSEFYAWDGNSEGRLDLIADIDPGSAGSFPNHFVEIDGLLHFIASASVDGVDQPRLYTWDGSNLSDPETIENPPLATPVLFRGSYYYPADFGGEIGVELARSDDGLRSVSIVHETVAGSRSGIITYSPVLVAGDYLYWWNNQGVWHRYNGTVVSEVISTSGNYSGPIAHEGRLYLVARESDGNAVLYVDDAGTLSQILAAPDEDLRLHGGREGAPLYASLGNQFYLVQGNQATALPEHFLLPHDGVGSNWHGPEDPPRSFAFDGKLVAFIQLEWETQPSWKQLSENGVSPYDPLAGEESIAAISFFPYANNLRFGDYIFAGSAPPIRDAQTTVSALRVGDGGDRDSGGRGEWTLKQPDATATEWAGFSDRQKIATTLNASLVDLGENWFWNEAGVYYYLGELPYLWDHNFSTWYYYLPDASGAYYYNFNSESWTWFSRDGQRNSAL